MFYACVQRFDGMDRKFLDGGGPYTFGRLGRLSKGTLKACAPTPVLAVAC